MGFLRRFGRDHRGVSAVEFALIAPVMMVMYAGLVEICQAMIAERKASHVAAAVGDLVTQAEIVSSSDLTDIFAIAQTVLNPYPTATLKQRVTSVTADAQAQPKVDWSKGSGGWTGLGQGSIVTLPMTLAVGESIVMSESSYQYRSPIGYVLPTALKYSETFYLRPRRSDKVTCTDC